MGGGHHITRADYQREELVEFLRDAAEDSGAEIYLEPGEAVALDEGILVGTVLDSHWNGMPVAVTGISATCHMPDVKIGRASCRERVLTYVQIRVVPASFKKKKNIK